MGQFSVILLMLLLTFFINCFARNEIKSIVTLTLSQLNSEIGVNRGHSPLYQSWAWVMAKLIRMTNSLSMFLSWNSKLKWTRLSVYGFTVQLMGGWTYKPSIIAFIKPEAACRLPLCSATRWITIGLVLFSKSC